MIRVTAWSMRSAASLGLIRLSRAMVRASSDFFMTPKAYHAPQEYHMYLIDSK